MDELRRTGLAKMNEVYAWEMPDMPGEYFALTADHLFGRIWTREGLSMRDKRLITLAVVTALGEQSLAEIQVNAALHNEEMTDDELREMAIFITHYVGFPRGSGFNAVVEKVIAKRKKAAAAGRSEDKQANVEAVLGRHGGTPEASEPA
ncbi:carboxymuconolactone decarboxylase family protein [Mycobacterium sp. M1]|uniref:Carboxymuconolactone decarboxylase family protein n=1 Tax=Mycolicibacter acidiphilus TaxID=2835306 RepID=A0ABS5RDY2_9MYCO|nr:carboxymuconolactone decarboxylase family protein [Mycolicibacter acidiphilus]MBS9532496.1 carboxymuconolactone decarboxylase family protein [Mycolicibacter acidiphilus]